MSIRYRKVQNKIDNSNGFKKWYGKAIILNNITPEQLCEEIAHSTTVTEADARAIMTELAVIMKRHLLNSESVVIEKLGKFKPALICKSADDEKTFTANNIKGYKIVFQPEVTKIPRGVNAKGNTTYTTVKSLLQGAKAEVYVQPGTTTAAAGGTGTQG